jgi:hypothetical protein
MFFEKEKSKQGGEDGNAPNRSVVKESLKSILSRKNNFS